MIMKVKLRSILAGIIPRDADYTRLVALVPDAIDDSNRHLIYYAKNSVPAWEIQLLSHIRNAAKKSQVDEMTKKVPVDTVREMGFGVDAGNVDGYADTDTDTDEEGGGDEDEDGDEDENEDMDVDSHEDMDVDVDVDLDVDEDEDEDDDDDDDDSSSSSSTSDARSDRDTDPDAEMDADEESVATFVGAAVDSRVSEAMEELEKAGLEAARKV